MRFDRMRCILIETTDHVKRIRLHRMRYFVFQCIEIASSLAVQGCSMIDPLYSKDDSERKFQRCRAYGHRNHGCPGLRQSGYAGWPSAITTRITVESAGNWPREKAARTCPVLLPAPWRTGRKRRSRPADRGSVGRRDALRDCFSASTSIGLMNSTDAILGRSGRNTHHRPTVFRRGNKCEEGRGRRSSEGPAEISQRDGQCAVIQHIDRHASIVANSKDCAVKCSRCPIPDHSPRARHFRLLSMPSG